MPGTTDKVWPFPTIQPCLKRSLLGQCLQTIVIQQNQTFFSAIWNLEPIEWSHHQQIAITIIKRGSNSHNRSSSDKSLPCIGTTNTPTVQLLLTRYYQQWRYHCQHDANLLSEHLYPPRAPTNNNQTSTSTYNGTNATTAPAWARRGRVVCCRCCWLVRSVMFISFLVYLFVYVIVSHVVHSGVTWKLVEALTTRTQRDTLGVAKAS